MRTIHIITVLFLVTLLWAGIDSCKKNDTPKTFATSKTALEAAIDSLTIVYNTAIEGSKPGEYAVGAKEALDTALALAGRVDASNAYTQQEVTNAYNNLLRAGQLFSA